MKKWIEQIDGNELLAAAGLGLLGYGLYLVSPSLALVVLGAILILLGTIGALRKGERKP